MTVKIVNYTPEMTAQVLSAYAEGKTKEEIGTLVGRSARSVVAKLTREGVYKAKAKAEGKREMLKAEMVAEISKEIGVSEEVLESLEKATGTALMAVLKALRNE